MERDYGLVVFIWILTKVPLRIIALSKFNLYIFLIINQINITVYLIINLYFHILKII